MFSLRVGGLLSLGLLVSIFTMGTDRAAEAAAVNARIDLSSQTMRVSVNGKHRYTWRVSTGKRGWRTPTGRYTPYARVRHLYSKRWKMHLPHLVYVTGEVAIHGTGATGRLGSPASHGCIRLAPGHAATFYSLVGRYGKSNTSITITH